MSKQEMETNVNNLGTSSPGVLCSSLPQTIPMSGKVTLSEDHQNIQKTASDAVQETSTIDVNEVGLHISTDIVQDIIITDASTQNKCKVRDEIKEAVLNNSDSGQSRSLFQRTEERRDLDTSKNVIETCKGNVINQINVPPTNFNPPVEIIDDANDNVNLPEEDDLDEGFLEFDGNFHTSFRCNYKHDPWRFNEAVRRNPHFIILKSTALPCLRQDMVLDHDQVVEIEKHFCKTPSHIDTPRRSPIQKILDYVNSPKCHDKENSIGSNIFDYNDFSAIKLKTPLRRRLSDKAKRDTLSSIEDNAANIVPFTSTLTKPSSIRQPIIEDEDNDIANYFGFDETDNAIPNDKSKPLEALPFRIEGYPGEKQKKQVDRVKEVEDVPVQQIEPSESQITSDSIEVHIFDDSEQEFVLTVPSKIYLRKPIRKRLKSIEEENEEEHSSKRTKKAEEAALEEWAAKFNSMCREIEKYDLEIE